MAFHPLNLLQRVLSSTQSLGYLKNRFLQALEAILFFKEVQTHFLFEFLLVAESVSQFIQNDKWEEFELLLSQNSESPHVLTQNQSLLNAVIKRKIDLHRAFQLTRYPSELDALLKKAGV